MYENDNRLNETLHRVKVAQHHYVEYIKENFYQLLEEDEESALIWLETTEIMASEKIYKYLDRFMESKQWTI